ncbi:hypothetical protein ACFXJO_27390 [Streptomyces lavendulae]|uniref:hypothetical protein n=1 Tax=Streptomyces TaxID=1883 RepID=UPI002475C2E3|nr:hypothetical protein [Streptomyces sp. SPB4]MDH6542532.1 hypothetical protein [Streptomyces sp. SPB4]
MPIDPYAALNAMLRAEAARYSPPVRPAPERPASAPQPAGPEAVATTAATAPGREEEPAAAARPGPASPAA